MLRNLIDHTPVKNKNSKIFYDEIAPGYSSIFEKNVHDDFMYMQVPSGTGKKDEVDKRMNITAVVTLLQAILAVLLVIGKTLNEQSQVYILTLILISFPV